jgi:reverse gyrase
MFPFYSFLHTSSRTRNRSLLLQAVRSRTARTTEVSKSSKEKKCLVIVESPAKAITIQKFLGKNYIVDSCAGHIRDLVSNVKRLPSNIKNDIVLPELGVRVASLGIDVFNDFQPIYVTKEGKGKILSRLRETAKSVDEILLATDEDREGEAISWHLVDDLKPKVPYKVCGFFCLFSLSSFIFCRELFFMKLQKLLLLQHLKILEILIWI